MKPKKAKKNFSSFTTAEAFQELQLKELTPWELELPPFKPSSFLKERLRRLNNFDLTSSEAAKELIIDALCEEVLEQHPRLKIWKAAPLQTETLTGQLDYLVAPRMGYLSVPLLCVVEAKKDDFEKGLAQCLVGMKAVRWQNEQAGKLIDVYGVVTNGKAWQFYKLGIKGQAFESSTFAIGDQVSVLSALSQVFSESEKNLAMVRAAAKAA
jgi:hypothetical protein